MSESNFSAPGWQALDQRFSSLHPGAQPHQFSSATPYQLDSLHPLPAITVWEAVSNREGTPMWHYLSYGLSELFEKTTQDPEHSGLGYELTFAIARTPDQDRPPAWALSMMQGLAAHLLKGELSLDTGSLVAMGRSLLGDSAQDDRPSGCVCVPDPVAGIMTGPFGRVLFLRLLGLCKDELELCEKLELAPKIDMLAELAPEAITDPTRSPWSKDEQKAKILRRHRLGILW